MSVGVYPELSKDFLKYPLLSQKRVKLALLCCNSRRTVPVVRQHFKRYRRPTCSRAFCEVPTTTVEPVFNAECRRHHRCLERRYRRTRDPVDHAAYVAAGRQPVTSTVSTTRRRRATYWSERIQTDGNSLTKLWMSLVPLLQRDKRSADVITPTSNDADSFLALL